MVVLVTSDGCRYTFSCLDLAVNHLLCCGYVCTFSDGPSQRWVGPNGETAEIYPY